MIRGLRGGLLANALLALGVVDLPPPRREREIDLDAAERAMANLAVVGIDVHKVLELAGGPDGFVAAAEICLANRVMLAEHGRPDVTDAAVLLGRDSSYVDPDTLQRRWSGRLEVVSLPGAGWAPGRLIEDCQKAVFVARERHHYYGTCGARGTCGWCQAKRVREDEEAVAAERHREVCQARRVRRGEQKAARKTKARKTAGRGW